MDEATWTDEVSNENISTESQSDDTTINEEYKKLIETNDCLAKQYEACRQQKDSLFAENQSLKQSLKECESMLQRKMSHDNNTWNEMETIHFDLNEKYKSSQIEIKRTNKVIQAQNKEINDLTKIIKKQKERKQHTKQMQQCDVRNYQNEIETLRNKIERSHHTEPCTNGLSGCLAETLKILHRQFNESLSSQMFLLWKKFIFALMQHFESQLSDLKESDNAHRCVNEPVIMPISYQEPRVVVKYKNKKKRNRIKSPKKERVKRSQTARKSKNRTTAAHNNEKLVQRAATHRELQQFRF